MCALYSNIENSSILSLSKDSLEIYAPLINFVAQMQVLYFEFFFLMSGAMWINVLPA